MPKMVAVGSKVTLKMTGSEYQYILVYAEESNLNEGKISITSPLGKSLLGQQEKTKADFRLPDQTKVNYEILKIL